MKRTKHEGGASGHNDLPRKVVEALAAVVVEAELHKARAKGTVEIVKLIYDVPEGDLLRLVAEFVAEAGEGPEPRGQRLPQ